MNVIQRIDKIIEEREKLEAYHQKKLKELEEDKSEKSNEEVEEKKKMEESSQRNKDILKNKGIPYLQFTELMMTK